jgi:hypothetical protein
MGCSKVVKTGYVCREGRLGYGAAGMCAPTETHVDIFQMAKDSAAVMVALREFQYKILKKSNRENPETSHDDSHAD